MPVVSASAVYPAPVDKVWAVLTDTSTWPSWNTVHVGFPKGAPDKLEPGESFVQKIMNMGMPNDINWTVVTVDEGRLLEFTAKAPMNVSVKMKYEIAEVDGGTKVDVENTFEGAMIKPLVPQLTKSGQASLDASMVKFGEALG